MQATSLVTQCVGLRVSSSFCSLLCSLSYMEEAVYKLTLEEWV
jgi:hypothetical protein